MKIELCKIDDTNPNNPFVYFKADGKCFIMEIENFMVDDFFRDTVLNEVENIKPFEREECKASEHIHPALTRVNAGAIIQLFQDFWQMPEEEDLYIFCVHTNCLYTEKQLLEIKEKYELSDFKISKVKYLSELQTREPDSTFTFSDINIHPVTLRSMFHDGLLKHCGITTISPLVTANTYQFVPTTIK